jgi:hypothetical protein
VNELVCDSCGAQRNTLVSKQSEIMKTMTFNFCTNCSDDGFEPRWLIILIGRTGKDVSPWLDERKYVGEDIQEGDLG